MTDPTPESGRELDERFRATQERVVASGSDSVAFIFGAVYLRRATGIALTMTDEEQREWAMRGAIEAGEAALKAVRADTEGADAE